MDGNVSLPSFAMLNQAYDNKQLLKSGKKAYIMKKPIIISVTSEKGGVGKTTTAYNVAGALTCRMDKKVCVIDLDPQQNLSQAFNYQADGNPTISELIYNSTLDYPIIPPDKLSTIIRHTDYGLDYIPASKRLLSDLPKLLSDDMTVISRAFSASIFADYDYIIIDCKNSLESYLVPQALCASDYVLTITECGQFSFYGLLPILELISQTRKKINPNLKLAGIVINKCPANVSVAKMVTDALAEGYANEIFKTTVPFRFSQTEKAVGEQKPCVIAKGNTLAGIYTKLTAELIERIERMGE